MTTITALIEYIQAQGERMTIPRRLVLEALGHAHEHLTISDVQQHIQAQSHPHPMSDTTVYRVLQWLKELGLVAQTDMGQAGMVYALISQPYHHHVICLTCGATMTVADDWFTPLRQRLQSEYGFTARIDHMAIYGHCQACSQKNAKLDKGVGG